MGLVRLAQVKGAKPFLPPFLVPTITQPIQTALIIGREGTWDTGVLLLGGSRSSQRGGAQSGSHLLPYTISSAALSRCLHLPGLQLP